MDATSPRTQKCVQQADAHLANLLRLADALPEFAVSPAFGGAADGDSGTVTDVLAQLHGEQLSLSDWLALGDPIQPAPRLGGLKTGSQHAHRPYKELRKLVEGTHGELRQVALDRGEFDALELIAGRYEWAHSVLGQCAL